MITDYKGDEQGTLAVNISPCKKNGSPLGEDFYVEEPAELLGKGYGFKVCQSSPDYRYNKMTIVAITQVTIKSAEISKLRFSKGIQIQYTPYKQTAPTITGIATGTSPKFNHSTTFYFEKVTPELIEWFENGCLNLLVYGVQEDTKADVKVAKLTTKELRQIEEHHSNDRVVTAAPRAASAFVQQF